MDSNSMRFYGKIAAHVIFCVILLFFFGYNCRLRPAAYPTLYKEYITGLFSIAAIYLNYWLLFPKLYIHREYKTYWLLTFCSVVLFTCLEMLLVGPQLLEMYSKQFDITKIKEYLFMDTIYVLIRNGGLVLFAFAVKEILWLREQKGDKESVIRKQYSLLDVKNEKHQTLFIGTNDIYYCNQERNNSVIHLLDGTQFIRYCSMNSLEELLGENEFIRISRNVIVPIIQISKCNENTLELTKTENHTEPLSFRIGDAYLSQVMSKLEFKQLAKIARKEQRISNTIYFGKQTPPDVQVLLEECNNNPKLLTVYHYISTHTHCKIGDISNDCKISKGSVSRYLAKLTKLKLISYNGAKKTGGYSVVSQD